LKGVDAFNKWRQIDLCGANLRRATFDKNTQFPEGFDLARLEPDTNDGTE
jgi:hypothetical protein